MTREKRDMKDMFDEFQTLGLHVQRRLGSIVQNQGMEVSDEELGEFVDEVNGTLNNLNALKEDVVRFYQD